jgi:hypothetical protein
MNDFWSPYKVLECKNFEEINKDLITFIEEHTDLLSKDTNKIKYCNFFENKKLFYKFNNRLLEYWKSLDCLIRDFYFTLSWGGRVICHLDKPPVKWKCNWPVLNMEKSHMTFYKTKDLTQDINKLITKRGNPNSKDDDHYDIDITKMLETHRYRFDKNPILINGQVPHGVIYDDDIVFPRIGIQFMFFNEPTHLL